MGKADLSENLCFVEEYSKASCRALERFLKQATAPWTVVFAQTAPAEFSVREPHRLRRLDDVVPNCQSLRQPRIAQAVEQLLKVLQPIPIAPHEKAAVAKAAQYLLLPSVTWQTVLKVTEPQRAVFICRLPDWYRWYTKWASPSNDAAEMQVMGIAPSLIDSLQWTLPWGRHMRYIARTMMARSIARSHAPVQLVTIGHYENLGSITVGVDRETIFTHLSANAKLPSGNRGWHYRDGQVWRALKALRDLWQFQTQCRRWMPPQVARVLSSTFLQVKSWQWEIDDLLCATRPKVLLTSTERDPMGIVIAEVARRHAVKTICLFNGVIHRDEVITPVPQFDYWLVWGDYQKQILRKAQVPDRALLPFGHMHLTRWSSVASLRRKESGRRRLLYFSQPSSILATDCRFAIAHIIQGVVASDPAIEVWVKPHPRESDGWVQKLWQTVPQVKVHSPGVTPAELLPKVDLVIGANSTALLEAWAAQVPVALFDPTHLYALMVEQGAAIDLTQADDPVQQLAALLKDTAKLDEMSKQCETSVAQHLGKLSDESPKMIAAIIRGEMSP